MRALLVLAALAGAATLSGCGTTAASTAAGPGEDPGKAMIRLVQHELAGRLNSSYAMLVREQREAVNHDLYVKCKPGLPTTGVRVLVLGVQDEAFNVPVLGKTVTKAVRYEMSVPDASGKRIKIVDKGHLIAQDGKWRWTLSERSLSAFLAGACP
jgi:uncharacterized protein YceK